MYECMSVCGRAKTVSSLLSGFEGASVDQSHVNSPVRKKKTKPKKTFLHDCFIGPHTVNINLLKLRANLLKLVEAHVFITSECEV